MLVCNLFNNLYFRTTKAFSGSPERGCLGYRGIVNIMCFQSYSKLNIWTVHNNAIKIMLFFYFFIETFGYCFLLGTLKPISLIKTRINCQTGQSVAALQLNQTSFLAIVSLKIIICHVMVTHSLVGEHMRKSLGGK